MPTFEVEHEGKKFRVDAADPAAAAAALSLHTGKAASPSMFEGVSRALARGVPLVGGVLNKANAATNAALAPVIDPLLPDSYEKLPGKTYGERYDQALAIQEGKDKAFKEEHPVADTVAEIAGGVASTGAAAATATGAKLLGLTGTTMPQLITRGAASGVAVNSADAAIRGEDPLAAGGIGGVIGAVSPVAGRIINAKVVQPVANTMRGILRPAEEAERVVASALNRDIKNGDRGLNLREMVDAQAAGQPTALIDAGGETTRAVARSAANVSPEGRSLLNRTIDERFESQAPRLAEWLGHTFHFPNASAQQDALDAVARTVNRPNYAKAYHEGANLKFDADLEQISQAPVVQDAIRKAMVSAKNDAAKLGFTPPKNPFQFDADGRLKLRVNEDGSTMEPNLQFWDIVKRNLDKTGTPEARDWARILRENLDDKVPSYNTARAGAAKFFGAGDALEAGEMFVGASQKFGIPEARKALAKMSAQEKQLFQDGYVSRLVQTIEKTPDRRSVLNKIATSPAAKEEMVVALGPQRAAEVEARLRIEGIMDLARPAVQGNSTTARQLVELGLAGGVGGYEGYNGDPQAIMKAALVYGAARGKRVIDDNVAKHVAKLLTSSDVGQLQKGVALISRNKNMMGAIRNADAGLASIAARGAAPTASQEFGLQ
ncbi:MAG: hypothetical protein PS018_20275 [bacterium]|nr:hypothetical protein [bacterium]